MDQSRRDFIRTSAVAATASAAGIELPAGSAVAQGPTISGGTRHLAASAARAAQFWWVSSRAVWWPLKATPMRRSIAV